MGIKIKFHYTVLAVTRRSVKQVVGSFTTAAERVSNAAPTATAVYLFIDFHLRLEKQYKEERQQNTRCYGLHRHKHLTTV